MNMQGPYCCDDYLQVLEAVVDAGYRPAPYAFARWGTRLHDEWAGERVQLSGTMLRNWDPMRSSPGMFEYVNPPADNRCACACASASTWGLRHEHACRWAGRQA